MKRLRRIFSGLLALVMILTLCHGMPFAGTASAADANVVVDIPGFANGTVKADKASYKIGDTITLTISPSAGYSQKLAINIAFWHTARMSLRIRTSRSWRVHWLLC